MSSADRPMPAAAGPPPRAGDFGLPYWVRRAGAFSWLLIGFLIAVGAVAVLVSLTSPLTTPVVIAACLAIVFAPVSSWLADHGLNRSIAAIFVLVGLVAITALAVYLATAAVVDQADNLENNVTDAVDRIKTWLADTPISADLAQQVSDTVADSGEGVATGLAGGFVTVLNSATGVVAGTALALIVLYYFLKEGPAGALAHPDHGDERATVRYRIANDAVRDVRGYFRGLTAIAVMNGVVIGLAAAVLGVPAALTIGVVNFVGAYVPYLGGFVGGALAVLMALGDGGLGLALAMLAVVLFVNLVLENLLQPTLVGASLDIGPLTTLLVTTLGGMLAGMVGLVLAAPLWAIAVDVRRELDAAGYFDDPKAP